MIRISGRLAAALLIAPALPGASSLEAQNGKNPFNGLDQAVERARTTFQVPGTYTDSLYGDVTVKHEGGKLVLSYGLRQGGSATLEHWHFDTFRGTWSEPNLGTTMLTFHLGGDAKVRSVDVEGLGAFTRAPERPR